MTRFELKKLRVRLDLSVAQAALQVSVTERTWHRWESGDRRIPAGAIKLFKLLNKVRDE